MIEELKELRAGRDRSKYPARLLILDMVRDEEIDRVIAELWEAYNAR